MTVSPDPLWVTVWPRRCHGTQVVKQIYRHGTVKEQHSWLTSVLSSAYRSVSERWETENISINMYFELNKKGHLHCHGIITCTPEQMSYISDYIYDEVGRPGRSPILKLACVNVQRLDENNQYRVQNGLCSWEHYIIKDQTSNWRNRYPEFEKKSLV